MRKRIAVALFARDGLVACVENDSAPGLRRIAHTQEVTAADRSRDNASWMQSSVTPAGRTREHARCNRQKRARPVRHDRRRMHKDNRVLARTQPEIFRSRPTSTGTLNENKFSIGLCQVRVTDVWKVALPLVLAVAIGCSDLTAISNNLLVIRKDESLPDYCNNFSASQCDSIQRAINSLIGNPNQVCQDMGWDAWTRFHNGSYHYDPFTTYYGYSYPLDDEDLWLGSRAFWPGELTNTIAHEEDHFTAGSSEDTANAVGNQCATAL